MCHEQERLRVFVNRCLRSIFKIRWPKVISNNELRDMAGQEDIAVEIARRKCSEKTSTTLPEKASSGQLMGKGKGVGLKQHGEEQQRVS